MSIVAIARLIAGLGPGAPWARPWLVVLLVACALVLGCGGPRQPLSLAPAPWQDGERGVLDVYGGDGTFKETVVYELRRDGDGWVVVSESTRDAEVSKRVTVTMGADLSAVHVSHTTLGKTHELAFEPDVLRFSGPNHGAATTIARPADAVDGSQLYQLGRALPFALDHSQAISFVEPPDATAHPMTLTVASEEAVEVPAGRFDAWRVVLDTGPGGTRELWYDKEPPHRWLRYRRAGVSELVLRSWRPTTGAAEQGAAEAQATLPGADAPIVVPWGLVLAQAVSVPLMTLVPLLIGVWLMKRYRVSPKVLGIGAATFIASQVVHLPLNALLGLGGGGGVLGRVPELARWIILGLSAGLCEELARYAAMRLLLRKPEERGWRPALVFGAGHGGIEAAILGGLLALSVVNAVAAPYVDDPATRALLRSMLEASKDTAWYHGLLPGVERIGTIAAHIAMSVLVMRAVTRRQIGWLLGAIAGHAAIDAAVGLRATIGILGLEALVLAIGATALVLTAWLREPQPVAA